MKIEEVQLGSVDDHIRQEKKRGVRLITWPADKYQMLKDFSKITGGMSGALKDEFMGVRHELCQDNSN